MLLDYFFGYAFHPKYFDIETGTVWKGVFDGSKILLVNLVHVDVQACPVSAYSLQIGTTDSPPAVFKRRPHLSHLKCLAF